MHYFRCAVYFTKEDGSQDEAHFICTADAADLACDAVEKHFREQNPTASIFYSDAIQI